MDHAGEVFGKLTVVEQCVIDNKVWCLCRCECGTEPLVLANKLTSGKSHCGCAVKRRTPTIDRVGERWGRLEVVSPLEQRCSKGYFMWLCRCDCGTEWAVSGHALRAGGTESCGCHRTPRRDFTDHAGKRYHDLTVLHREGSSSSGNATWRCRCICGNEVVVVGSNLVTGNTKSCGCRVGRKAAVTNRKHGQAKAPLGRLHDNIKQRCYNPANKAYPNYGGRGIELADHWHDAATFIADVTAEIGERPSSAHSFDRIDNERNYEPGNIRWATRSEQSSNRRMGRDIEPMRLTLQRQADRIAELEAELAAQTDRRA